MANLASCPKCQKAIAMPDDADPQSWVRCPLCGGQYQLHAAIAIVLPSLEVISQPSDQQPADAPTAAAAAHPPDFPTMHEVSPHLATHFAAIPHAEALAHRPSPNQKNLLFELGKIVLGGMAGLLLGYAILFWGFRVDPFHLAKNLPAPLVPHKLAEPAQ